MAGKVIARPARRWLIKLDWTYTLVKKGVYMDGHERCDVVHYRDHEFLPAMLKFEECMVHYEYYEDKGPDLIRVEPKLTETTNWFYQSFTTPNC